MQGGPTDHRPYLVHDNVRVVGGNVRAADKVQTKKLPCGSEGHHGGGDSVAPCPSRVPRVAFYPSVPPSVSPAAHTPTCDVEHCGCDGVQAQVGLEGRLVKVIAGLTDLHPGVRGVGGRGRWYEAGIGSSRILNTAPTPTPFLRSTSSPRAGCHRGVMQCLLLSRGKGCNLSANGCFDDH